MIDLRKRNLLTLLDFSADEITYMLDLAARLCGLFVTAGEKARGLAGKAGLPEKIRSFTKKFAKPSSIFRRKGIK